MIRKLRMVIPLALMLTGALAFGQSKAPAQAGAQNTGGTPSVVLAYFDSDQQITVTNKAGMQYQLVDIGMQLLPGDQISTRNSTAELELDPNGTIIKLAPYTDFSVNSLQGDAGAAANDFTLKSGSLHAVAAHIPGAAYLFRTNSAVGGVRGTDFGMQVIPGKTDALFVREGTVVFTKNGGQAIAVAANHFADALAPSFQAVVLSASQMTDLFKGLSFTKLDIAQVPGQTPTPQPAAQPAAQPTEPATPSTPEKVAATPPSSSDQGGFLSFLRNYLSFEIGGVSIDGTTYSQLVVEPHFQIGKLKMALYLPVIYSSNLFDAGSWYHPAGNNEWSFGTDQPNFISGARDFLTDLMLKIRYVEYGKQRDPFFLKIGNLNDMTIGHGILMQNFANDSDFPSVRRTGLNLGFDFTSVGFETVVNDLANPQVFGGRFYFRPLGKSFPAAIGVSSVADIAPASGLTTSTLPVGTSSSIVTSINNAIDANPLFLNLALDLDLPVISTDPISVILFGDIAGLVPYIRNPVTVNGTAIASGFHTEALLYTNPSGAFALRNFGIETGLFGNLLGLNYRLEYRLFNGIFQPSFYNSNYERMRGQYAQDILNYLASPNSAQYDTSTMGIYGEAGFSLFKAVNFTAGYFWPWTWDTNGQIQFATNDYLKLKLSINPKVLPLGFYGSISYERTKFIPMLLNDPNQHLALFDANTVVSGELVYPVAPTLDLILDVATAVSHDSAGNVIYDKYGNPSLNPTVTIETRIGF